MLFSCRVYSFRDNWTGLSTNGFPVLNFANFGFAPQTQILIYIFFYVAQYDCNQNRSLFLRHVSSFRDNWTSLSTNGFPVLNFANFGFTPQTQISIYIFFLCSTIWLQPKTDVFFHATILVSEIIGRVCQQMASQC